MIKGLTCIRFIEMEMSIFMQPRETMQCVFMVSATPGKTFKYTSMVLDLLELQYFLPKYLRNSEERDKVSEFRKRIQGVWLVMYNHRPTS